jgi:hypothetical protein
LLSCTSVDEAFQVTEECLSRIVLISQIVGPRR